MSTINAVSVSPKREYNETDEENEYENEDKIDEQAEAGAGAGAGAENEKEKEKETKTGNAKNLSVRVAIMLFWLVTFHLASSTIITGIKCLIVTSAKCFGGIILLTIFVLPAAYAIYPERVYSFKFRSLAPTITDGLYKLDYLTKRVVRALGDKLGDKLKIKQA